MGEAFEFGEADNALQCADCCYWRFVGDYRGKCIALPPATVMGTLNLKTPLPRDEAVSAVWPVTKASDLCSRFRTDF